jgi:spore coat polysaccharide biosynthesis predicted glycosyltransferase SpsG
VYALCIEASHVRGMGHLFRGLVLAAALERRGAAVRFLVNDEPAAAAILQARGREFDVVLLDNLEQAWEAALVQRHGVRVWVNDRLQTDARHAKRVLEAGAKLATFDDYGTGAAFANLHVAALPAGGLPATGERVLSGLRYLLLDPAIERYRRLRKKALRTIVTMGGSDTHGITVDVARVLRECAIEATIVLGPAFRHEAQLAPLLDARFTVKRNVPSLAAELAGHDLAVTAGGITLYEACASGLPCIAIAAELWERNSVEALARLGACADGGYRGQIDRAPFQRPLPIEAMSSAGMRALDFEGAQRVAEALLSL